MVKRPLQWLEFLDVLWADFQGLCPISLGEIVLLSYYSSFCRMNGLSLPQALGESPPAPRSPSRELASISKPPGAAGGS